MKNIFKIKDGYENPSKYWGAFGILLGLLSIICVIDGGKAREYGWYYMLILLISGVSYIDKAPLTQRIISLITVLAVLVDTFFYITHNEFTGYFIPSIYTSLCYAFARVPLKGSNRKEKITNG